MAHYDSDDDTRHFRDRRRDAESLSRSPPRYKRKRDASPSISKSDHHIRENRDSRNRRSDYRRNGSAEREPRIPRPHNRSRSPYQDRRSRHGYSSAEVDRPGRREYNDKERSRDRRRDRPRRRYSQSPSIDTKRSKKPLPSQQDAFDNEVAVVKKSPPPEKQKPNFGNTGRLAAESNTITSTDGKAIVLKYHEPPEARKPAPKDAWRMYVFKGPDLLDTVELGQRSCWLFGREVAVADFPVEHPSCSKQHAVIQFRYVERKNEYGDRTGKVKPYIIDLESANGTEVNGDRMPSGRYYELRDKDVIKFGESSREYVMMLPSKE